MIKFARISKNGFLGRFGTVRPKSRKTGFFGKNPAGSTFFEYCPPTSGQKSGKSLEPFSRNFRFTTIFGPFWAILGHFGTVRPKISRTRIFSEKRLGAFLTLIVRNLHAKMKKIVWADFEKKCLLTNQLLLREQSYGPWWLCHWSKIWPCWI